jgi:ribose/xylose/arabinose/galactoside ABC-type transport system permease subunit
MRVLGFSVGHDKGAVVIENGKVVVGITQERLSRIKHDGAYSGGKIPVESINYCLNSLGITYKNIDLFVYSTTEEIDYVETQFYQLYPRVVNKTNLKFLPHHLAHAYSVFFSSGLEEAAVIVADASGSIWLGLLIGSLAGALLAGIHALLSVVLRANQIVAGLALVIFGTGLANFLGKPVEGKTVTTIIHPLSFGALSDIPFLGPIVFGQDIITYASITIAILSSLYLFRSRPGLELRATGDDPATVDAQGLSVASIRIRYTLFGGLLVGLGGSWLMFSCLMSPVTTPLPPWREGGSCLISQKTGDRKHES